MDNRLNEMSEKLEEQTTNSNYQLQNRQNQNNSQRGSQNYRGQGCRGNRSNNRGRYREINSAKLVQLLALFRYNYWHLISLHIYFL